ncbi:helix-turn-helix domain-containing protein [Simplicispira suum]|nr:helix-turn-helix transcriptional regulator [Simplicispira suum]
MPEQPATKTPPAARRGGRPFVFRHEVLLAKRAALGMTQTEMGVLLTASPLSVYRWETGKAKPREAQLKRIRQVLKMGVREARKCVAAGQNPSALA